MWPHGVVVLSTAFDYCLRHPCGSKPFERQTFISKLAVDRFVGAILPRFAGVDVGRLNPGLNDPFQDGLWHELRAIV